MTVTTQRNIGWLCVAALVVLTMAAVVVTLSLRAIANGPSAAAYRTLDELLADHRRAGWQVVQAPSDQQRYQNCGAIQNDLPHPDQEWIEGAFHTADGRTRKFRIEWPDGYVVAVEGLDPADGDEVQYAVLMRPFALGTSAEAGR